MWIGQLCIGRPVVNLYVSVDENWSWVYEVQYIQSKQNSLKNVSTMAKWLLDIQQTRWV